MALFKISKGLAASLPSSHTEGYCYFTTDDGKFYVDISDEVRVCLNAYKADYAKNGVFYGTSSSSSTTQVKSVTLTDGEGFTLRSGAIVTVKFSEVHNSTSAAYLNVASTGAKPIRING